MVKHWHGDVIIEWKDGEWERLQKIKKGEYVPLPKRKCETQLIHVRMPSWLKERIEDYSKHKGISQTELIKQVLYVLTQ